MTLGELFFTALVGGVVVGAVGEGIGQALHGGNLGSEVVGVLVVFAVIERFHKLCGGVAQVERDRLGCGGFNVCGDGGPGGVDGVGFGCKGEVDSGLGEGEIAFR